MKEEIYYIIFFKEVAAKCLTTSFLSAIIEPQSEVRYDSTRNYKRYSEMEITESEKLYDKGWRISKVEDTE